MPPARQASFAGGEFDPLLYGRTDHPRYPSGLRKCQNFIIGQQGAITNRSGTKLVAKVKDSTISPRLIPFIWFTQNYVLEFGNLYLRFHSLGGPVLDPATNLPLEVVTPFSTAMLPYLKFAQKDATLTICYGGQDAGAAAIAPQELKRISHTNWTIGDATFAPPANGTRGAGPYVPPAGNPLPDTSHIGKQWWWWVTQILRDANGNVFETAGFGYGLGVLPTYSAIVTYGQGAIVTDLVRVFTSLVGGNIGNTPATSPTQWAPGLVVSSDKGIEVTHVQTTPGGYTRLGLNYYRAQDGTPGLLATLDPGQTSFVDDGRAVDFSQQPPKSTNPFTTPASDYPAVVTYFQQRRTFGRRAAWPARLNASKTGQPSNFDTTLISQETDALDFNLATQTVEEIRSLVSVRALIALTQTGAVLVRGGQSASRGTAISPFSIDATKQSQRGASWVDPVVVDNIVVFLQAKGSSVRAIFYNPTWEQLDNPGNDLAIISQHLLRSHSGVDMAYQETPDSVIWIPREDGLLIGLTFVPSLNPDQQVYAWHQHVTDGSFEHVACVPEGTEDAAYFVVKRTVNGQTQRYIERMASRSVSDVRLGVFLDSALTFDGRNTGVGTMKATGATYNGGDEVTITASIASFVPDDVGSAIVILPDGTAAVYDPAGKLVTAAVLPTTAMILAYTDSTHVTARLEANLPAAFQNVATTSWGFGRRKFSGLSHLEGKTVAALADGAVAATGKQDSSLVVTAGQIVIDEPAVIVHAGLPYNSDLELLDIAVSKLNVKSIQWAALEVVATRSMWAGETFDKLKESRPREVKDNFGNPALKTGIIQVIPNSSWNLGGRAAFRQVDPLPITVVAAIREVILGGN